MLLKFILFCILALIIEVVVNRYMAKTVKSRLVIMASCLISGMVVGLLIRVFG